METLKTFFKISVVREPHQCSREGLNDLKDKIDLVLEKVKASEEVYIIRHEKIIKVYFKCDTRKRRGQIVKACDTLISDYIFTCETMSRENFFSVSEKIKNNKVKEGINIEYKPIQNPYYTRSDIKVFDDKKKWHGWQKDIYAMLFNEDGSIKQAHDREIISIIDKKGNSGKSSFFKYLLVDNTEEIGRLGYGTAAQLRTRALNMGRKKLYIIDLARTKGKGDSEIDLLSAIEDLKSGVVIGAFYGRGDSLIMDPPAIVISSNYEFDYTLLSKDRWAVFEIRKNNLRKIKDPVRRQIKKIKRNKIKKDSGSSQMGLEKV